MTWNQPGVEGDVQRVDDDRYHQRRAHVLAPAQGAEGGRRRQHRRRPEQPDAQVSHHALADGGEQVAAEKVEDALGGEDGDQPEGDLVQQLGVVAQKDGVDQELQGVGPGQPEHAADHDGQHGEAKADAVGPDELQQPPELAEVGSLGGRLLCGHG